MPEIGEVARIVSYIHKHLVGKTLSVVKAQHDDNVFGKVGCSAAEFEKALLGKKVLDAKQQGKYFWLVMSSPPHPLMHFGMAGWFKIRNDETAYYKPTKKEDNEWPPKYWKFMLETQEEPKCEAAFVDFRRFGRVRLVDCAAEDMRKTSPLKENGPDPVIDKDIVTVEWLSDKLKSKKIPVKALLLDQANISGIGNWVGDEIMYNAKMHPEQYSNTLSDAQIKQLHKSIHFVCSTAVETKADSSLFPRDWLFKHRWGKGKKDSKNQLPNGEQIKFIKVGGRTSAVIPSVQKKTGPVAGDVKAGDGDDEEDDGADDNVKDEVDDDESAKPKKGRKRAASTVTPRGNANGASNGDDKDEAVRVPTAKRVKAPAPGKRKAAEKKEDKEPVAPKLSDGKERSGTSRRKAVKDAGDEQKGEAEVSVEKAVVRRRSGRKHTS